MANTIFEKMGDTYTQVGNYMLPDLLPAEEEQEVNIGVWAMRHKRYLKQNHKVRYYNLLTSGKLNSYLTDVEEQAQHLFSTTIYLWSISLTASKELPILLLKLYNDGAIGISSSFLGLRVRN